MPYQSDRFPQLRGFHTLICLLTLLGGVGLVVMVLLDYGDSVKTWMLAAGGLLIFLSTAALSLLTVLLKVEANTFRQFDQLRELTDQVERQEKLLTSIVEQTRISDAAKSLAHRGQELQALREAIHEDVRAEKWEAAFNLIEEMEKRFGYRDEAARLRVELRGDHELAMQSKLDEAIVMIERHFAEYDWTRAEGEIARLQQLLPDHDSVRVLPQRLAELREVHKQELLKSWAETVANGDTNRAIEVLRELDQYLTPEEAQSLRDDARHVFKEKLLQMGMQFSLAVKEKRWQDALDTGRELIEEFPNARMADEVRGLLEVLRERAGAKGESAEQTD
jgi:hypothetical protein